jgi:hypothetical protein
MEEGNSAPPPPPVSARRRGRPPKEPVGNEAEDVSRVSIRGSTKIHSCSAKTSKDAARSTYLPDAEAG